jgi:hypothetical protein
LINGSIGVDSRGWHQDWAVCKVADGFAGVNRRLTMDQDNDVRQVMGFEETYDLVDGMGNYRNS